MVSNLNVLYKLKIDIKTKKKSHCKLAFYFLSKFSRRTGIFALIMGYAKERGKLEKLLAKIAGISIVDEKNLSILIDSHEKYSHTVRILKNKNPDAFMDLYKNELQEIKEAKKTVKQNDSEEARDGNFTAYKDSIIRALKKTIKISNEA